MTQGIPSLQPYKTTELHDPEYKQQKLISRQKMIDLHIKYEKANNMTEKSGWPLCTINWSATLSQLAHNI